MELPLRRINLSPSSQQSEPNLCLTEGSIEHSLLENERAIQTETEEINTDVFVLNRTQVEMQRLRAKSTRV